MPTKIWSYCEGIPDPVDIPEITVLEMFRQSAKKFPDRFITEFKGKFKKYNEIEEEINRFANSLKELGIKKGDRVAC